MMNKVYRENLDKIIGEIIELYVGKDGIGWRPYLRIRVWINLSRPLICGKLIDYDGNQSWISFKYERLPNFCFHCGITKHPVTRCSKGVINSKIHEEEQLRTWLRASLVKISHKSSFATSKKNCQSRTSSFNRKGDRAPRGRYVKE